MTDNQINRETVSGYVQQAQLYQKNARHGEALQAATQAVNADPLSGKAWECLGYVLLSCKQWQQARNVLELGVRAAPYHARLLSYYALALTKTGETRSAWQYVLQAQQIAPDTTEPALAAIEVLSDAGYYDLALRQSETLSNEDAAQTTVFLRGALSFQTGDCSQGLALLASVLNDGWNGPPVNEWCGGYTPGEHVAFFSKQGFGDFIQFARYLPRARARVGASLLVTPQPLERLMRDSFPDLPLFVTTSSLPAPERQQPSLNWPMGLTHRCSLTSLPTCLGEIFEALPQIVPYLSANAALAAQWRERNRRLAAPAHRPCVVQPIDNK